MLLDTCCANAHEVALDNDFVNDMGIRKCVFFFFLTKRKGKFPLKQKNLGNILYIRRTKLCQHGIS